MKRILAIVSLAALSAALLLVVSADATVPIWHGGGDLSDASTMVSQTVVGVQGHPVPAPSVGALQWDGGSYYWGPTGITTGLAGQALWTNDAGAATTWAYPHGDVDASSTDPGKLTVNAVQGFGVSASVPSSGNALMWNGSLWKATQPHAGAVTLEQFGAVGDGTTNDSAAMTSAISAIASGGTIQLGCGKTYLVGASSPYTVPAGATIVGCGDSSIIKTATNAAVFVPGGEQTQFRGFQILGSGAGASQIGIANQPVGGATGYQRMVARNITCTNLGETCILTNNLPGPTGGVVPYYTTELDGIRVFGPATTYGLWLLGEYSTATNIKIDSVGEGIRAQGGNQSYSGGSITNCTTGFHLIGGGNDAHGTVTGFLINHNTTNLLVDNAAANTEHFVNDAFYGTGTAITLNGSHNVFFDSCQIDVSTITLTNAIGTTFSNCTWPGSFANAITQSASTTFASGSNVDLNGNPSSIVAASGWVLDTPTTSHGAFTAGGGGSDFAATIGPEPGAETAAATLHLLPIGTARTSTNFALQSDGNNVYVNAPNASSTVNLGTGTNTVGSLSLAAWTLGFSDSRAVGTLLGSLNTTTRTITASLTIDSGGKADRVIYVDCTSSSVTLTLPPPTNGRTLTVIDKAGNCSASGHTITLARHATEKIDGTSANVTNTNAGERVDIWSDGTDWYTREGTKFQ